MYAESFIPLNNCSHLLPLLKARKINKVYSGKPGCMCGCVGNWKYASDHPDLKDYHEVSDRSVKIISNKIWNNESSVYDPSADCIFFQTETRNLVAYFA